MNGNDKRRTILLYMRFILKTTQFFVKALKINIKIYIYIYIFFYFDFYLLSCHSDDEKTNKYILYFV